MKGLIYILITISFFSSSLIFAQRLKSENKNQENPEELAEISLQEGKFEKALLLYRGLLENDPQNPLLNFFVGYCYLNTDYGLLEAIEYLKTSINLNSTLKDNVLPIEAYYFLAKAYHTNFQFQLALDLINKYLVKIPQNNKLFIKQVMRLQEICDNAIMLSQTSADIKVEIFFEFNSKYSDLNPLIFNEGKELVFTSRRENPQLRKKLDDDQFDENIYYSNFHDDEWQASYGLSKSINSTDHESACWISNDGSQLILRRMVDKVVKLYICSKNQSGEWSVPEELPEPINSRFQQTYGCLSPDGKLLYFTSDRKGGYGGTDIYVSENKGNNIWGIPINLGDEINTPYNEESPFMQENGVLLFCSEGHVSMGGFDIFATYQDISGNWIRPVNMGLPLNSIEDDFFYQTNANGNIAYSSSTRKGTKGKSDIYYFTQSDSITNGYALVSGNINFQTKIEAEKNIEIGFNNILTGKNIRHLKPNKNGFFNFILPAQSDYEMTIMYMNSVFYKTKLHIPKSYSFLCMDQSIRLNDINLLTGNNLQLINKIENSNQSTDLIHAIEKLTEKIKSSPSITLNTYNFNDSTLLSDFNNDEASFNENVDDADSIYSIKIASSKSPIPINTFNVKEKVNEQKDNTGNYIYYIGEFNYEWEALIQLRLIKENYPNASIFVNKLIPKITN